MPSPVLTRVLFIRFLQMVFPVPPSLFLSYPYVKNPRLYLPPPKSLSLNAYTAFSFLSIYKTTNALFKHYWYRITEMLLMHFIVINSPMFLSCLTIQCNFTKWFEYISSTNNYS